MLAGIEMDDLTSEFVAEAGESLGELDNQLVKLEQNPNDAQILGGVFRLVHTIKGACGFMGLKRLEAIAHAAESVLSDLRDGKSVATTETVSAILETIDCIKEILNGIEATGTEPPGDDSDLIAVLQTFSDAGPAVPPADDMIDLGAPLEIDPELQALASVDEVAIEPKRIDPPKTDGPARKAPADLKTATQNVRVAVNVLEDLMNLVSELVMTRNQLLQTHRATGGSSFGSPLQRLDQITTALHEGVVKTRMQPVGFAWRILPRIVRDLERDLGKQIKLQMIGDDTEIDRQVLEMIRDPLIHMVRNACDHGLETVDERRAARKPAVGRINLQAFHEAGQVVIRIADDGRGLATAKIAKSAVAKGLATQTEVKHMAAEDILDFIFEPGFSTVSEVTNVSGRGVGMDIVRSNVEKHGGTVEVHSVEGVGSTFTVRFPLTLAVVPALVVGIGDNRFAVPQANVVEVARVGHNHDRPVELAGASPVLRLRDRMLPLSCLAAELGFDAPAPADIAAAYVVVCEIEAERFGVVVDHVFNTEEVVVKPVAPVLRDRAVFLGNAVLGDGDVAMIVDPNRLYADLTTAAIGADLSDAARRDAEAKAAGEPVSLLLFRAGAGPLKAVSLARVARLEDVPSEKIVHADSGLMLQHRGDVLPLIDMGADLDGGDDHSARPAVVFHDGLNLAAILVDEIVDIVDAPLDIFHAVEGGPVTKMLMLHGKPIEAFDVDGNMQAICAEWTAGGIAGAGRRNAVLVVDDSPFFRHLLSPLLQEAGYDVTTAANAAKALAMKQAGRHFDLIVSELQMHDMDGFDFAQQIKTSPEWSTTPLVAMCASVAAARRDARINAGFEAYAGKTDRESLLRSMAEALEVAEGAQ